MSCSPLPLSLPACLPPMPFSLPPFSCLSLALFLFALSLPLSSPSLPPLPSHVSLVSPYFPFFLSVFPPPSFPTNLLFFSLSVYLLYPFLLSQSSPLFYLPYLPWVVFPHLSTYLSPYLPLSWTAYLIILSLPSLVSPIIFHFSSLSFHVFLSLIYLL